MRQFARIAVVMLAVTVLLAGAGQLFAGGPSSGCPTPKHACRCPDIVAPVTCDGGCTYVNGCVAGCAGAKNCVPNPA